MFCMLSPESVVFIADDGTPFDEFNPIYIFDVTKEIVSDLFIFLLKLISMHDCL